MLIAVSFVRADELHGPVPAGTVDLTFGGAYAHFEGDDTSVLGLEVEVDDAEAAGFYGRLGYFFADDLEIALSGGMVWGDTEISVAGRSLDLDVDVAKLGAELLWHLSDLELLPRLTPYVGVGGGAAFFEVDSSTGDTDDEFPEVHGIVGLRLAINDSVSVIAEYHPGAIFYDDDFLPDGTEFQQQVLIGLTLFLR